MIFRMRILHVDMMIYSLGMIIIIQIKRDLFDVELLNIVICKFKMKREVSLSPDLEM